MSYAPNILIVTVELVHADEIKSYLNNPDYKLFTASSACETLETLKQNKIDIVILEINSGNEDIIELLRLIKSREIVNNPYVILISENNINNEFIETAIKEGADGLIHEPIVKELLNAGIKVLTRIKSQEDEILKSQQRLETIIEASLDGLLVLNKKGNIIFANKAAEKIYGLSREALEGRSLNIPVQPDFQTEMEINRLDGKKTYIETRIKTINWDNKEMYLAAVRDITEMQKIRLKLAEKEGFYRKLTEKNLDGILMVDKNANITFCAAGSGRHFDLNSESICSLNMIDIIHPECRDEFKKIFSLITEVTGSIRKFTWKYLTKSYKEVWLEGYIQNLLADPVFNSILINFRDITEITISKEELRKKASELQLIYEAGKILNQTLDLQTIYEKFFGIVSSIMDVNDMVITSYNQEDEELQFECVWDDKIKHDVSTYPKLKFDKKGKGVQSRAILYNKAYLINDYVEAIKESNSVFVTGRGMITPDMLDFSKIGAKSSIACPLHNIDRITGVLQIFSYKINAYTETDLRILQALSNNLAMTMINAKLYEKIQKELKERIRIEKELTLSEERFNAFMKNLPAKAWIIDKDQKILFDNAIYKNDNYDNSNIIGKSVIELMEKELDNNYLSNSDGVFNTNKTIEAVEQSYRKDGTLGSYLVYKFPVNSHDGEKLLGGIAVDITDRLMQEEELKSALAEKSIQEHRFKEFMEHLPALAWITDKHHNILYSNKVEYKINFKDIKNVIGKNIKELFDEENYQAYITSSEKVLTTGIGIQVIEKVTRVNGTLGDYLVYKFPLSSSTGEIMIGAIAIDISERLSLEESLKASVHEKEVLLREIHHRVKNNMQIISSLLSMQSDSTNEAQTANVLNIAQNRVRSMALIHEQLYTSDKLSKINFEQYACQLINYLFSAYEFTGRQISSKILADDIELDLEIAIPVGLITNELISNALKYAFSGKDKGTIEVKLENLINDHFKLTVSDDGIGLPEKFDIKNLGSMGLNLVEMLVSQLSGMIEISNINGTTIEITFKKPFYKPRLNKKDTTEKFNSEVY